MSVHGRIAPPEGHGEVLCVPHYAEWTALVAANRRAVETWPETLRTMRSRARREILEIAEGWTRELGVEATAGAPDGPIVMTGHQPELYHPGVWVKVFLLDRLARDIGATGIDLVVDTDRAEEAGARLPHLGPPVVIEHVPLSADRGGAYVQAPLPSAEERSRFRERGAAILSESRAPALGHHFVAFCDHLDTAAARTSDLAQCVTAARRSFESPAGVDYLEAPVSRMASMTSYRAWAASLLGDAQRFMETMNDALGSYRMRTGTRSAAQPFPDLERRNGLVEAPFWLLCEGRRERVWVRADGALCAGEDAALAMPGCGASDLGRLAATGSILAPKAVTLTMFARVFLADLFIHGTGGGRYDRVTDAVIAGYYGIVPPRYAVASMTLLLPFGAHVVTGDEVAVLAQQLHRLEHNPDAMLDYLEFDDEDEYRRVRALADRKASMVDAIGQDGADKKAIGAQIRAVNAELADMLQPVVLETRDRLERAKAAQAAAEVLTDRTYPYCLWDPREVADKVR